MSPRTAWGAIVLALAMLALAPARARAQDPDTAPPGTAVLGPFRFTPTVVLKDMGVDNNVRNEAEDPKSDFTLTVTPRAVVAFRMRRLRLTYDLGTDYVYFHTYRDEGGVNTTSLARADLDLGRLRPYVTAQGTDTKARANAEIDARARHQDRIYGAGTSLQIASRTRLLVSGETTRVIYDSGEEFRGVELSDTLNGRRVSIDTGVGFQLTPLTTMNILAGRDQQRFSSVPDRDSDSWRIGPTFSFSPDGLLTGSASVGYRHFHTLSPTLPDYSGVTAAATAGALLYGRHQLQLTANRDVHYSYDLQTQYYVNTAVGITWTMALVGPFDLRGTAQHTVMNYRADNTTDAGTDTVIGYGGGFGYRIASKARIGVTFDRIERDSTRSADRGYRNHRLFAGLTWGTSS